MQDEERRPATLDEVLDAMTPPLSPPRHGIHSPLYEALWDAHDRLAPHLNPPRRPDWRRISAKLAERGVLDGKGNLPTSERTRKAWWKVERDKDAVAQGQTRRRRRQDAAPQTTPAPSNKPAPTRKPPGDDELTLRWAGDPERDGGPGDGRGST